MKVQNKNGFDLSHLNCGTSKCGQLVPVMCKLLPPNSDFTLGVNLNVSLPPLATDFMGRVDAILEGFVVPLSILYGGWKQFISNQQDTQFPASQTSVVGVGGYALPYFNLQTLASSSNVADFDYLLASNENLCEYLGMRDYTSSKAQYFGKISLLPLLAYHLTCDVFYRNKQITKTWFAVNPNHQGTGLNRKNVSLIWHSFYTINDEGADFETTTSGADFSTAAELTFPDGTSIFSTRQRNYARDYFTAATPSPQQGNASRLAFSVDSDGDGSFTLSLIHI